RRVVRRRAHHVVLRREGVGGLARRVERAVLEAVPERPQVRRRRQRQGHVVDGPLVVAVHEVLRVEQEDLPVGGRRRRLVGVLPRLDAVGEGLAALGVVPRRRHRGLAGGQPERRRRRRIAAVAEDGEGRQRLGVPPPDADGDPVARGFLVGLEEDGVALAGVEVDVVDDERLHVVAVGLHHRHLVLQNFTISTLFQLQTYFLQSY
uniref:Uncharacterized protein n=1 Tax=Oryza brachyantha TaxID=4533 RepID=J3MF55_ORYBR